MPDLTREQWRTNRNIALDALKSQTGSSGGDVAGARIDTFRDDPTGAASEDFVYVGALRLTRFYVDPSKSNAASARARGRRSAGADLLANLRRELIDVAEAKCIDIERTRADPNG